MQSDADKQALAPAAKLCRFTTELDSRKIPHTLHLFLDTVNAPASAVCATIFKASKGLGYATTCLGMLGAAQAANSKLHSRFM